MNSATEARESGFSRIRRGLDRSLVSVTVASLLVGGPTASVAAKPPSSGEPLLASARIIPAFARKYRTSCSTCHTAAPKLNVMGEAFRLNGYRFPENDQLLRKDEPVELGAPPWKDLWPRAIWPGEISETPPVSLRMQTDVVGGRDASGEESVEFKFPNEIYLLAGGTFGPTFGFFLETEWSPDDGIEVIQAKAQIQNVLPGVPDRLLNLWVGLQNPYFFTFTDRQIDRAGREKFAWQEFRFSDLAVGLPGAEPLPSPNQFGLGASQASLEVNGLAAGRLFYALGLAQGATGARDNNDAKDVYYRLRYKLGGLRLDGRYDAGGGPVLGGGGQLQDRSIILEHFGYFGAEPVGETDDEHRSFGVSLRVLFGPLDAGLGATRSDDDDPWGLGSGGIVASTLFGRIEYMFFPWLIGSLKWDHLSVDVPQTVSTQLSAGVTAQDRVIPGAILLLRQNIRAVVEGQVFTRYESVEGDVNPWGLAARLDFAF